MKKFTFISALILMFSILKGQTSILQDGDGETSLQVFQQSTIVFNSKNSSIGFSLRPKSLTNQIDHYWNFSASANSKDDVATILKGGTSQFGGKIGCGIIFDETNYGTPSDPGNGNIKYQFITADLMLDRFDVFDSSKTFDDQIYSHSTGGIRLNYGWNFQNVAFNTTSLSKLGSFSLGASASIGLKDNSDDIDALTIVTASPISQSSNFARSSVNSKDAYSINDISFWNLFGRLNVDVGKYCLKQRLFANLHTTFSWNEAQTPQINSAFGVFVLPDGSPLAAVVGIQIQAKDLGNFANSKKNLWERSGLVLTAGFPFD